MVAALTEGRKLTERKNKEKRGNRKNQRERNRKLTDRKNQEPGNRKARKNKETGNYDRKNQETGTNRKQEKQGKTGKATAVFFQLGWCPYVEYSRISATHSDVFLR